MAGATDIKIVHSCEIQTGKKEDKIPLCVTILWM